MKTKLFEVRDRGTRLFVMATKMDGDDAGEKALLDRAGWGSRSVLVCNIDAGCECNHDPYKWGGGRTLSAAHRYIQEHFDELEGNSVVDVEYINGEVAIPKAGSVVV